MRSGVLRSLVALVDASRGNVERARELGRAAIARLDEVVEVAYGHYARQILGFLEISLGNAAVGRELLGTYDVVAGIEGSKRLSFIGDTIEALVTLGDLEAAANLADELERRGAATGRPTLTGTALRCRALVLGARGDLAGAIASAEASVAAFEGLRLPFEHARSLLVLGEVQRRAKQRKAARQTLTAAEEGFDRLGARLWSERAAAERARIGGRTHIEGLTETELRVAELVAAGRTNKEVAAELFVSVRAVEANLSRVYAKLGIESRTELARRL
jgi:DNA-binding NarL/FixJ family response regulator